MSWKDDKVMLVLAFFTVFFTVVVLSVDFFRPSDGQVYQTFVSLLAGFAGALTMHLKSGVDKPTPPPGSTTVTQVEQVTTTPPNPPAPATVKGGFGSTGSAATGEPKP